MYPELPGWKEVETEFKPGVTHSLPVSPILYRLTPTSALLN